MLIAATFCSCLISYFLGMLLIYILNDFRWLQLPIITGYRICFYIQYNLYFQSAFLF